jgi:corrinoid protein of di/trimethylamine methyltransferase
MLADELKFLFLNQEDQLNTDVFQAMAASVIAGEEEDAAVLAREALEAGIDPLEAINQGFIPGIEYVGQQFSEGEMFLPELVMAGEAMKAAVSILEPEMAKRGSQRQFLGKVVLATVQGDIHDIGKTLVGTLLSSNGFQVVDMGVDVPLQSIIDKAEETQADLIALSALLTTTMVNQRVLIQMLEKDGIRDRFKVIVGGAPASAAWAEEIGADGFSSDAVSAVGLARKLVGDNSIAEAS